MVELPNALNPNGVGAGVLEFCPNAAPDPVSDGCCEAKLPNMPPLFVVPVFGPNEDAGRGAGGFCELELVPSPNPDPNPDPNPEDCDCDCVLPVVEDGWGGCELPNTEAVCVG